MARLKLLLLLLVFCGLSTSQSNAEEPEEAQCTEHCQCWHTMGHGMNLQCDEITSMQRFEDSVTSFYLDHKTNDASRALELPNKFFIDLGNGLKHVDSIKITGNILKIDRDAFQGLNSLTSVNLINNSLSYIHPETFANNSDLRQLSLKYNPITFDDYLLNIPDLRELDLSFCQLHDLTPNTFDKLTELVYINLESNNIVNIHPKTFETLTYLEELNLSNNKIQSLSADSFKNNEVLNVLRLNHNPLVSIENLQLPSITELDLQYCDFTKLTSTSFVRFPEILKLNLSGNLIEELSPDSFSKLKQLLYLDLSNNKLGSLDSRLFSENQELETLSLKDNPSITLWPEEGFQGRFQNLYRLDISNTGIKSLALGSLKNMSDIAQLDLSRNALTGIEANVLPRKIKFLSLAFNNITSMKDINFPNECQVRHLFLQGNKIKYLNRNNFDNLPYLSRLDLSSCKLETIWLEEYTEEPKITKLRQLNLSKNKLTKIVPNDLNAFSNLGMLDIRDNPLACNDDLKALLDYLHDSPIEPVASSDVGNIDENFETFQWEDIRTKNCDGLQNSPQKPNERLTQVETTSEKTKSSSKSNLVSTNEHDSSLYDNIDYEDIINIDNESNEDDQYDYDTNEVHYRKSQPTQEIVEISETSPVAVVFLSALVMTLIITLILAFLTVVCKQKLIKGQDIRKRHGRTRSSSYRPLHENEQQNMPTTPIVKIRTSIANEIANTKNDSYICNVDNDTYSSTDYHHSHITPQTN